MSIPKNLVFKRSYFACVKEITLKEIILIKIVWGLLFTIAVGIITMAVSFTPEEIAADPILLGVVGVLVAMCCAIMPCYIAAVISRD